MSQLWKSKGTEIIIDGICKDKYFMIVFQY